MGFLFEWEFREWYLFYLIIFSILEDALKMWNYKHVPSPFLFLPPFHWRSNPDPHEQ